ncbi:MAG: GerMN domain-containing protein [Treponema sp.]|nr:GerMN domain-containing protein [Treponema sp.]
MSALFNTIFRPVAEFLESPVKRCFVIAGILFLIAVIEFFSLGLARRTFVFYTIKDGIVVVEDRMLKHSQSREGDIIRYVEETLLGPVSPELLPLVQRGTQLKSLLFRNGIVYADFTSDAAMPPAEGGRTLENFRTFHASILRNFSYVKEVRFFIEGTAIFAENFL